MISSWPWKTQFFQLSEEIVLAYATGIPETDWEKTSFFFRKKWYLILGSKSFGERKGQIRDQTDQIVRLLKTYSNIFSHIVIMTSNMFHICIYLSFWK